MNVKFGLMAGAAIACAVMAGCKAPKAQAPSGDGKVQPHPAPQVEVAPVPQPQTHTEPAPVVVTEPVGCKCAPGTVHDAPCKCGAADCKCKVREPEPEYTLYRVKGGDMLSVICRTYGLRQKKVLELNPGLNPNKLYAGRKIKLPGKIELKGDDAANVAPTPATEAKPASSTKASGKATAKAAPAKATSYNGATKEYVVKNGDFLGKIAAECGVTVKCLKEMNGLKNNNIRVGQKLKVPAEKPVAAAVPTAEPVKKAASEQKAGAAEEGKKDAAPVTAAPDSADAASATEPAKPVAKTPDPVTQVRETTAALEPAAETQSAAKDGEVKLHTVKENEDVVSIAIMYNVSPSAIMDLNDLKNAEDLTPGKVLKLPPNAKQQ